MLTMPLFVVVYPHAPVILLPFGDRARIDHIVTFLIIAGCFYVLLRKMRLVLFALLILGGVVLTWSSFTGRYRPGDLVNESCVQNGMCASRQNFHSFAVILFRGLI